MAIQLNPDAVAFAEDMIGQGNYRINTVWREAGPNAWSEDKFLENHDWEEYSRWFLAEDTSEPSNSKARYQFPVGDFKSVHRSGLTAAKDRAQQQNHDEVAEAADDLLFFFDRISAC